MNSLLSKEMTDLLKVLYSATDIPQPMLMVTFLCEATGRVELIDAEQSRQPACIVTVPVRPAFLLICYTRYSGLKRGAKEDNRLS